MSYPLRIHYDFLVSLALKDPHFGKKIKQMKSAGVSTVWLDNYFYGSWDAVASDICKVKAWMAYEGFEVQALNVPFGHGGQALDPSQPVDNTIGEGWRNRMDAYGVYEVNTTCPNEKMMADSREAATVLQQLGFTKLFYDDDMRLAHWGEALQGCFCPHCMARFYQKYPRYDGITPTEIVTLAKEGDDLWSAWCDIQCNSVLGFLEATTPEGMTPGVMVMHNGDKRHGIDILRIKEKFPNALFRVGEGHFSDDSFEHPLGKIAIENSIRRHMSQIGRVDTAFSESTTYPVGALSPENWIEKMKIEIKCGLRNIFLMSGIIFLTDPYWDALAKALPELQDLALSTPIPNFDECPEFVWHL